MLLSCENLPDSILVDVNCIKMVKYRRNGVFFETVAKGQ